MSNADLQIAWDWTQAGTGWWSAFETQKGEARDRSWMPVTLRTDPALADPYDFWRSNVFYGFEAEQRQDPSARFSADAYAVLSPRGEFVHSVSSDLRGARRARDIDRDDNRTLTIGFMLSGVRDHETVDGHYRTEAGGLYVYDAGTPSRLALTQHAMTYLAIDGDSVDLAFGNDRLSEGDLWQRLERSPLLPYFRMQLDMQARTAARPDPADAGSMLHATIDLALLMLRQVSAGRYDTVDSRRGLMVAAQHVIIENLTAPDLDADFIANRIGASRATLYRAFADQGLTIAGHVRAIRLIRARHLLEHSATSEAISDIVLRAGLSDPVHFSRQFRQLFGIQPSDIKSIRAASA